MAFCVSESVSYNIELGGSCLLFSHEENITVDRNRML